MKKIMNFAVIACFTAMMMLSCTSNVNIGKNNGNTYIIDSNTSNNNGNNNHVNDSFIHLTGIINNLPWNDGMTVGQIGTTASISLSWDKLPLDCNSVEITTDLVLESYNKESLIHGPLKNYVAENSFKMLLSTNDYRITKDNPASLVVTVVPLEGTHKKAVTLTAKLYR